MSKIPSSLADTTMVVMDVDVATDLLQYTVAVDLDRRMISAYADALKAGRTLRNIDPPVLDHQHRLLAGHMIAEAVLKAECSVRLPVVQTYDGCLPSLPPHMRTAVPAGGVTSARSVAAGAPSGRRSDGEVTTLTPAQMTAVRILRELMNKTLMSNPAWANRNRRSPRLSAREAEIMLELHPRLKLSMPFAANNGWVIGAGEPSVIVAHYILTMIAGEVGERFLHQTIFGSADSGDSAALRCRRDLRAESTGTTGRQVAVIFKAWNGWLAGDCTDEVTMNFSDPFPWPVGLEHHKWRPF